MYGWVGHRAQSTIIVGDRESGGHQATVTRRPTAATVKATPPEQNFGKRALLHSPIHQSVTRNPYAAIRNPQSKTRFLRVSCFTSHSSYFPPFLLPWCLGAEVMFANHDYPSIKLRLHPTYINMRASRTSVHIMCMSACQCLHLQCLSERTYVCFPVWLHHKGMWVRCAGSKPRRPPRSWATFLECP